MSYEDNIDVGTVKAVVTDKGSYTGTAEAAFAIAEQVPVTPATPTIERDSITDAQVTFAKAKTAKAKKMSGYKRVYSPLTRRTPKSR